MFWVLKVCSYNVKQVTQNTNVIFWSIMNLVLFSFYIQEKLETSAKGGV